MSADLNFILVLAKPPPHHVSVGISGPFLLCVRAQGEGGYIWRRPRTVDGSLDPSPYFSQSTSPLIFSSLGISYSVSFAKVFSYFKVFVNI